MDYNIKIKIGTTELHEFAGDEKIPYITSVKVKESTSLNAMEIGATASDALYFTMVNPYAKSFDGEKVELFISPQADTSETGLAEIQEEVQDATSDSAIEEGIVEALEDDDEEGEVLTPEEEAEAEAVATAIIESSFDFLEGEADTIVDVITEEEEEPEWELIGTYYVFEQLNSSLDGSISFECLDGFSKMGEKFEPSNRIATVQDLYDDYRTQVLDNLGIEVDDFEFDTIYNQAINWSVDVSYREALGYFAGIVGGYASFDADNSVGISFYVSSDTIILESDLISYDETSAGQMLVEGIACDRSINPYKDDVIETGSGQSIHYKNPFVTQAMLDDIYEFYMGVFYAGANVTLVWHDVIQSGHFVRIMTNEEYANYLELSNALAETDADEDILSIKDNMSQLGKTVLVSNQTIDFTGNATTNITSICDSEFAKENKVASPTDGIFKRLYAEMIEAEYLQAKGAFIADLTAENLQVESINGNVIKNSAVLARALSNEMVETILGVKVYYSALEPSGGTYHKGDIWYKTLSDNPDPYNDALYVYSGSAWVETEYDIPGGILRANLITAQEIAANTITGNNIAANTLKIGKIATEDQDLILNEIVKSDIDDLNENLNGVTTYQYTTGGTTYSVYIDDETDSYYYTDDEGERVPVAEDDLDVDSDGNPITNIEGGSVNELSRNVEQIEEDLSNNVQEINVNLSEIRDVAIRSLINQGYATIEDGNLRIYNAQDENTYMVLTSALLAFMKGDIEIASVINYEDEGTLKADNAIISTLRMRNAENGVGEFAWVQSETGHLSLKKA